jgi:predicted ester cyclase
LPSVDRLPDQAFAIRESSSSSGKPATWSEIHSGRVVNGRLTEHWGLVDQLGMLVQLGIVPAPGRVAVAA